MFLASFFTSCLLPLSASWEQLYPGAFSPSHALASFNTRDLHTVDDAVSAALGPELARDGWAVLVRNAPPSTLNFFSLPSSIIPSLLFLRISFSLIPHLLSL